VIPLLLALVAQEALPPREPGLSLKVYEADGPLEILCPLVAGQTPNVSRVVPELDLRGEDEEWPDGPRHEFISVVEGYLEVSAPGLHGLRLASDDGSRLSLDGKVVIDHDGLHAPSAKVAEIELAVGCHALRVEHFQNHGGYVLRLEWKPPGAERFEPVPAAALSCRTGEVRVTSPGKKRVVRPLRRGSPGDLLPLEAVHPALELATVRPEGFEPRVGGLAWLPDGRLAVATWDATGAVWMVEGAQQDDPAKRSAKRFAAGLAEPLGLCAVGERVFVLQKQELTELVDLDRDGVADEYRCLSSAWQVTANFHEFAFGLLHVDGWLHFNLAVAIDPGGRSTRPQVEDRGTSARVRIADGAFEILARGLRTPNGIGAGPGGSILVTDNQGDWLPCSKLVRIEPGSFHGSRSVLLERSEGLAVTPPVLWLPQNEIGNSPSEPLLLPEGFGPYSGQLVHGDVTHGGIKRDFLEVIDGVWQGCVFRWTQGLEAGVNRLAVGPDGALYAGGIGSTGNWSQEGKRWSGLQRLRYAGPPAFEMLAVRARSNGFEVELTEPLAPGHGWERLDWRVLQWRYEPTAAYGGPKLDEEELPVQSASVSPDRLRVFLEVEGLREGSVVHLRIAGPLKSASGRAPWTTEAWYTLNRIPRDLPGTVLAPPPPPPANVLSEAERRAGWKLLFDGRTTRGWRGFRQDSVPDGWQAVDGTLARVGPGGDLVTEEEFASFELALEWRVSPGGNSGIFFHVSDDRAHVWETGPEMQVLDNERHPDGRDPRTSAGSNYALHAPARDVTRPAGLWNEARLLARHGRVEHWLNGTKLLEYSLWTPEWEALVAGSKFAAMEGYGRNRTGRIALQDHGDPVAFRNIRIRTVGDF